MLGNISYHLYNKRNPIFLVTIKQRKYCDQHFNKDLLIYGAFLKLLSKVLISMFLFLVNTFKHPFSFRVGFLCRSFQTVHADPVTGNYKYPNHNSHKNVIFKSLKWQSTSVLVILCLASFTTAKLPFPIVLSIS